MSDGERASGAGARQGGVKAIEAATALDQFVTLEAEGAYRETPDAPPQTVILTFGARALTMMGGDEVPLGHWPLASLRADPEAAEGVLLLAPGMESPERLALSDPVMIDAISRVCPDLHRIGEVAVPPPPARRGWLRWIVIFAALGAVGWMMAPSFRTALINQIPEVRMRALEAAIAAEMPAVLGEPGARVCASRRGQEALAQLAERLGTDRVIEVRQLSQPLAMALPGGRILLSEGLLLLAENPEALAGAIAHALGHVEEGAPDARLRAALSAGAIWELLLGADLPDARGLAERLADHGPPASHQYADQAALRRLGAAGLPTTPFALLVERIAGGTGWMARHPVLGTATRFREADRIGDGPFEPALPDRDWVALREICG